MGFTLKYMEDGTVKGTLNLKEEETIQCEEPTTKEQTPEQTKPQLEQVERKEMENREAAIT